MVTLCTITCKIYFTSEIWEKYLKSEKKRVFGDFKISVNFGSMGQNNEKLRNFAISSEFQAEVSQLNKSGVNFKFMQKMIKT